MSEFSTLKESLAPLLRILSDLDGQLTFPDDSGTQFVITKAESLNSAKEDMQLALPSAKAVSSAVRRHVGSAVADDVLERINRDLALASQGQKDELVADDLSTAHPTPPAVRVRFEPIKGDLPPQLQE